MGYALIAIGLLSWPYSVRLGNKGRSDWRSDGELYEVIVASIGALMFVAGLAWNGWIE